MAPPDEVGKGADFLKASYWVKAEQTPQFPLYDPTFFSGLPGSNVAQ